MQIKRSLKKNQVRIALEVLANKVLIVLRTRIEDHVSIVRKTRLLIRVKEWRDRLTLQKNEILSFNYRVATLKIILLGFKKWA